MLSSTQFEKGLKGSQGMSKDELPKHYRAKAKQLSSYRRALGIFVACLFLLVYYHRLGGTPVHPGRADASRDPCSRLTKKDSDRFACQAEHARNNFLLWLNSQSRTLPQAQARYEEKYKRKAPAWFPTWYEFAVQNRVSSIDDYDQIEADLKPFRAVEPHVLKANLHAVGSRHKADDATSLVSMLRVRDRSINMKLPNFPVILECLMFIVEPIVKYLPDLDILVNFDDRPMVREPEPSTKVVSSHRFRIKRDKVPAFLRRTCPANNVASKGEQIFYKELHNVCNPSDYEELVRRHGAFQTEADLYNITTPIMSSVKMSTHQDVLYPQRLYQLAPIRQLETTPWEEKSDSVFWRGSNSGQTNTIRNWSTSHRPRWVLNAQFWERLGNKLREASPKEKRTIKKTVLQNGEGAQHDLTAQGIEALSRLPSNFFNVSFTNFIFCLEGPEPCDKLAELSPKTPHVPEEATHEHKFLFDLDGYGMSERYYGLLLTNSVVLKQTEWSEWHDEFLIPWVHFVPVSLGMKELPALFDFLLNDDRGKAIAKRMASDSKEWVLHHLSRPAQQAYMMRLLLEYGDIFNRENPEWQE